MADRHVLALFSVGPVQSFIASARRTEDLWSGSYLLSFLVEEAIAELERLAKAEGADIELIYPIKRSSSLFDQAAAFPNRFLVQLSLAADKIVEICLEVEEYLRLQFAEICLFGLKDAFTVTGAGRVFMEEMTFAQARDSLEVFWAIEPVDAEGYETARQRVESRLGAVKNNRNFSQHRQFGIVCTICGEREALHQAPYHKHANVGEMRQDLSETWQKLRDKYRGKYEQEESSAGNVSAGRIKTNEHLCGVCLGKRTARDFLAAKGRHIRPFRSTVDIASPGEHYAVAVFDGDDLGQWLAGTKGEFSIPAGTKEYHRLISNRLSIFSGQAVPRVIDEAFGELVYAGGDDVLAFLPADTAFQAINGLREAFSSSDMGLHPEATASAGMTIVHKTFPLSLALEHARRMERLAKVYTHPLTKRSKDAIGVAVCIRGGARREFVIPWMVNGELFQAQNPENAIELMEQLGEFLSNYLSPNFLYRFGQAFLPLTSFVKGEKGGFRLLDDPAENNRLLVTEMTRLLERSLLTSARPNSSKALEIPNLAQRLIAVHDIMPSGLQFVHWLESVNLLDPAKYGEVSAQ